MPGKEKQCCVKVCRRKKGEESTTTFFRLPTIPKEDDEALLLIAKKRKEVWLKKINADNSLNLTGILICNQHFYTGKPSGILDYDHPDWAPSINLNDVPLTPAKNEALKEKLLRHKQRIMQEKESKKSKKRKTKSQLSQSKKARMDIPVKKKQIQSSNNVELDQDSSNCESSASHLVGDSEENNSSTDQEDNLISSRSSLPEQRENFERDEEASNDSEHCDETSFPNERESDVNTLSLEELREELVSVKNQNKELIVKIAQKTEEIKQVKLNLPTQSLLPVPPSNNEPSANQEPRWKILHVDVGLKDRSFLLDGLGHRMTRTGELVRKKKGTQIWMCAFSRRCKAVVWQTDDRFVVKREHTFCKPIPNLEYTMMLWSKTRQMAKEKPYETNAEIMQSVLEDPMFNNCDPSLPVPNPAHFAKIITNIRKKLFPPNPEDLFFKVEHQKIPDGFLREEVIVTHSDKHRERHLIFATEEQTDLLKSAKCWFVDRTSRFINDPFVELVSIHVAYCTSSSKTNLNHVPLLYIFMSSRKEKDYLLVFDKILEMLGNEQRVKEIVFNYRTAVLKALEQVLPSVSLYGCPFQWSKTLLRNFKSFGLISLYEFSEDVQKICSRVFALHLLPGAEIPKAFRRLKAKAGNLNLIEEQSRPLMKFFKYVEKMWINNSVWTPERWSVFMQPVTRTDADAWHQRLITIELKHISKLDTMKLNFYTLVMRLCKNVKKELPGVEVRLLSQRRQAKIVRKQTDGSLPFYLYQHWDSYNDGGLTRRRLLKTCAAEFIERSDLKFVYDASEKHLEVASGNDDHE